MKGMNIFCLKVDIHSTKTQDQLDSLAAQEQYYEARIKANPNWKFAGIYSDVGSVLLLLRFSRCMALKSSWEMIAGWCALMRTCLLVFHHFMNGDSLGKISDTLARMGIVSPTGRATWSRETISKLLANEKYMFSSPRDLVTIANGWCLGRCPALKAPLQSSSNLLTKDIRCLDISHFSVFLLYSYNVILLHQAIPQQYISRFFRWTIRR